MKKDKSILVKVVTIVTIGYILGMGFACLFNGYIGGFLLSVLVSLGIMYFYSNYIRGEIK